MGAREPNGNGFRNGLSAFRSPGSRRQSDRGLSWAETIYWKAVRLTRSGANAYARSRFRITDLRGELMRSRLIAVVVALCCASVAPLAASEAATSPQAQIACLHARIGGHSRCLQRGEYCARRYERQYEHYGFKCTKRDRRGRYHLQ